MKRNKRGPKSSPKQSLNLPDLDHAKSAVLNSLPSKESQRGYRHSARILRPASGGLRGQRKLGARLGNWLTFDQAKILWQAQTRIRSRASGIERCLESVLGAACAAKKRQN